MDDMTTGIGLVLLGIWLTCAAAWHSKVVSGNAAIALTVMALIVTWWLK
jgi:hypothetical protein